jgi:hypothetical protein
MTVSKIAASLAVGINQRFEVVIVHPRLVVDDTGFGHIAFTPDQARNLARLLIQKAGEAEKERREVNAIVGIQ